MYLLDSGQDLHQVGIGNLLRKKWVRLRVQIAFNYRYTKSETRQLQHENRRLRDAEFENQQLTSRLREALHCLDQTKQEIHSLGADQLQHEAELKQQQKETQTASARGTQMEHELIVMESEREGWLLERTHLIHEQWKLQDLVHRLEIDCASSSAEAMFAHVEAEKTVQAMRERLRRRKAAEPKTVRLTVSTEGKKTPDPRLVQLKGKCAKWRAHSQELAREVAFLTDENQTLKARLDASSEASLRTSSKLQRLQQQADEGQTIRDELLEALHAAQRADEVAKANEAVYAKQLEDLHSPSPERSSPLELAKPGMPRMGVVEDKDEKASVNESVPDGGRADGLEKLLVEVKRELAKEVAMREAAVKAHSSAFSVVEEKLQASKEALGTAVKSRRLEKIVASKEREIQELEIKVTQLEAKGDTKEAALKSAQAELAISSPIIRLLKSNPQQPATHSASTSPAMVDDLAPLSPPRLVLDPPSPSQFFLNQEIGEDY